MSLRIGIDVDGVLADFRTAFHEAARESLHREIECPEDPKSEQALLQGDVHRVWQHVARQSNWWMGLEAYEPQQIARLYSLTRAGGWEVFFLTNRPASAGDTVQFQTQWWIERHGFYLPAVLTVPGSRGEVANGLRLDLLIDDLAVNCIDVVSASQCRGLLLLRDDNPAVRTHAIDRGIGVVATFEEALAVLEKVHELLPARRGRLLRLIDWFAPSKPVDTLPHNPRVVRPLPPLKTG
jgi:hypothetical protein